MTDAKHYLGWYDESEGRFEPDPNWRTVAVWVVVGLIAVVIVELF